MNIEQLKSSIEDKTINERFMVWELGDEYSEIIAKQYLSKLSDIWNLDLKYIDDINEIPDDSFIEDTNLYIIKVDKWESTLTHDNCIVICKKSKSGIKFPKLVDWQIIDYAIAKLPGINKQDIEWLLSIYGGNYFRFLNDIGKLSIFDKGMQSLILNQMIDEGQFDVNASLTLWDLSNAILKKDIKSIRNIIKIVDHLDISPLGLTTTLLNNFNIILNIQTNPRCSAKDVGVSDKQFFVIKKYNVGYYSSSQLEKILKFLSNVEYMFKYDEFPLELIIDYIVCEVLGV